jgi:hypothetical protein
MTKCAVGAMLFGGTLGAASSANAAVVSLFDFTTVVSPGPYSGAYGNTGTVTGSNPLNQWSTEQNIRGSTLSPLNGTTAGALTMANPGGSPSARSMWKVSKSGAGIDLSANKFIEFNVTNYTGADTAWIVTVGSSGTLSTIALSQNVSNSTGKISFDFNTWSGVLPTGFSFATITSVQLQIDTRNIGGVRGASSITFDQMVAAVPAPGALALLGVAGIVGARRRRA